MPAEFTMWEVHEPETGSWLHLHILNRHTGVSAPGAYITLNKIHKHILQKITQFPWKHKHFHLNSGGVLGIALIKTNDRQCLLAPSSWHEGRQKQRSQFNITFIEEVDDARVIEANMNWSCSIRCDQSYYLSAVAWQYTCVNNTLFTFVGHIRRVEVLFDE